MHVNLVQQMTRVDKNDWYNNTYRNCEYNHDIDLNCFCKRKVCNVTCARLIYLIND